jgi:hypothetical protein
VKTILSAAAIIVLATALPAWSQSNSVQPAAPGQTNEQTTPGAGGVSKPGTPGLPGSKSGPAATGSSGSSTPLPETSATQMQDQSKVPGLPGGKSGSAVVSPGSPASTPAPSETGGAAPKKQ